MAVRESPKSMLQAFIENVRTTAPLKRTRSMARSPESQSKETAPNRKKRRTRSSFVVQQTPRTMIESYMVQHKTQSPIGKSSRRRSVSNLTNVLPELQNKSMVTPRTAFEGFIDQASDETPYQKSTEDSDDEDSDSDFQIPNETIVLTQSPVIDQDSGPITMSQKERRQNQHHITLQQFSKGLQNHSAAANNSEEKMFTSDDESDVPSSTNLQGLVDSINSTEDDSEPIAKPQIDQMKKSLAIPTKENLMIHNRLAVKSPKNRRSNLLQSQAILTPSKQIQALSEDESVTYQSSNRLDLIPSRRTRSMMQIENESDLTPSRRTGSMMRIENESVLTPSRRARSMMQIENESDLTPSRRDRSMMQIENEPDLTPSQSTRSIMRIENESDLTPSRRARSMMQIENESDLTPSRRARSMMRIENESDLTPSRRARSMMQIENESDLTPSRRSRSVLQIENGPKLPDLTPSRRTRSIMHIENESDLTPSRRTRSVLQIENEPDLTPSRRARSIMHIENEPDLTPSRRARSVLQIENEPDLTPSRRARSVLQIENEPNLTPSRRVLSVLQIENEPDLTPSRKARSIMQIENESDLTPTRRKTGTPSKLTSVQIMEEPSHMVSSSTLKSPKVTNTMTSIGKNVEKSQMMSNLDLLEVQNDREEITNISTSPIKERVAQNRHVSSSTPNRRTPLSSNITILENIRPLSSSTPAKIVKDRSYIGTPSRVPIKSTPLHTPGREPIKSTPLHTPGRVPIKSSPLHMPGRLPITTPSSTRHDLVGRSQLRNLANKSSLLRFVNDDMSDSKIRNRSIRNSSNTNERDKGLTDFLQNMNKSKPMSRLTAVEVSTRVDDELAEDEGSDDQEESEEEDTIDRFKLKTPHLQENISRIPTPIHSSTPASVKQNQLSKPQTRPASKNKQKNKMGSLVLPNTVIKQVFQHFTKMRVIPDTMNELVQFTDTYFKNTFNSLEAFALHARRKTIDDADVELMMKRQGFITDKLPMDVLVENILPLELRQDLVPMATAYNIVVPL